MSSKKIYLIRHGQTDYNLNKIVQGSGIDSSLNATGRKQAKAFYEFYKDINFDAIYTSTLKRTQQTVEPFLNNGHIHEAFDGLKEINWGAKEGIKIDKDEAAYYNKIVDGWRRGELDQKLANGESPNDVAVRLRLAVNKILNKEKEDTILICMHGRAMRILLCILLNYPIQCMDYFPHENTSLYQIVHTGSLNRINRFNDNRHLLDLEV